MRPNEIIEMFKENGKRVFNLAEYATIANKSNTYSSLILAKNKNVKRIEGGKFYITETNIYEIASNIIYPSYVSLFSALRYYNLTTQIFNTIFILSPKSHKTIEVEGYKIKFIKIAKDKVFGYVNRNGVFIASIEKAIVDCVYFNLPEEYIKRALIEAENIDYKKLFSYAYLMKSKVLLLRLSRIIKEGDEEKTFDIS